MIFNSFTNNNGNTLTLITYATTSLRYHATCEGEFVYGKVCITPNEVKIKISVFLRRITNYNVIISCPTTNGFRVAITKNGTYRSYVFTPMHNV